MSGLLYLPESSLKCCIAFSLFAFVGYVPIYTGEPYKGTIKV